MKLYTILLSMAAAVTSCTHVYYSPNTANAPLLTEKGETRINALYSSGGVSEFEGGELQIAHAVGKNFAVMMNGMTASKSDEISTWDWTPIWDPTPESHTEKGQGSYIEFAGGYFKTLDKNKKWIAEIYSGIGFGSANNDYGYGDHSKVNSTKIFLQPAIGYKTKHFETALVPKFSFINWQIKENSVTSQDNDYVKEQLNAIDYKPHFLAFEPALIIRAGSQNLKIQTALSYSFRETSSNFYTSDLIERVNASIGISINLKPKHK
jgi:hypothetical protein